MPRGRWQYSAEKAAIEIYVVLIRREKPTKSYSREKLRTLLSDPDVRSEFLRLCFEHDGSNSLVDVRKGLLLAVQAVGPTRFTRKLGVNRVSLYRMLSPKGNPSLLYLVRVLKALGMHLWAVDQEFMRRRERLVRPKDVRKDLDAFEVWSRQAGSDEDESEEEDL